MNNVFGYAVVMDTGHFVGIWQEHATAELVRSKQPPGHNDEVVPVARLEKLSELKRQLAEAQKHLETARTLCDLRTQESTEAIVAARELWAFLEALSDAVRCQNVSVLEKHRAKYGRKG